MRRFLNCLLFLSRVLEPVIRAIAASGMTLGEIHEIILLGAGTRVPKVQKLLDEFIGSDKELGKNLNTDEAAAMGAVYKAADLSTGFRVNIILNKFLIIFELVEGSFIIKGRKYSESADGIFISSNSQTKK